MGHKQVLIREAVDVFAKHIGGAGEHIFMTGEEEYQQPYVDISLHFIQMQVAGFAPDFDKLIAVSGASALFGYKPGDFMAKYAHIDLKPDVRIAEATGFGYTWINVDSIETAWETIVQYVDAGKPLKGWDWENILFAGYVDAENPDQRQIYAMVDGPDTYSKWLTWTEFSEWYERVRNWAAASLGVHTQRMDAKPVRDIALQVINDLVKYSYKMPVSHTQHSAGATFGLAGIAVYQSMCADIETYPDVVACHDINPQWTTRNSTSMYLRSLVNQGVFSKAQNVALSTAVDHYRAAFECWQAYYILLGHRANESTRQWPERRSAGVAVIGAWLAHEQTSIEALKRMLDTV